MRILLVDDEEEFVSTLAERLSMREIAVQWTTTSLGAIKLVETEPFDLAVLDVKMPGLGGLALKQKLQAIQPGMKFLFLTGYGSEKDFKSVSDQLGRGCYIVKPIDIDDLIGKIKEVIKGQGEDL
jgi:DNA-binding response OmpR family regulator